MPSVSLYCGSSATPTHLTILSLSLPSYPNRNVPFCSDLRSLLPFASRFGWSQCSSLSSPLSSRMSHAWLSGFVCSGGARKMFIVSTLLSGLSKHTHTHLYRLTTVLCSILGIFFLMFLISNLFTQQNYYTSCIFMVSPNCPTAEETGRTPPSTFYTLVFLLLYHFLWFIHFWYFCLSWNFISFISICLLNLFSNLLRIY